MKVKKCPTCKGDAEIFYLDYYYYGSPFGQRRPCPRCAGTGKAWEPVPLAEALGKLLDEQYWESARRGRLSWTEAGGTPHISKEE